MTRKHFNELAAELKHVKPDSKYCEYDSDNPSFAGCAWMQWKKDCEAIADVCRRFHPAFDRERFLKACGYYE